MKNISTVFSTLALIGVAILFGLHFTGNKKGHTTSGSSTLSASGPGRIAYVDIDSLEANYIYLKTKKDDFTKRQAQMKAELENSARQMESDIIAVQRKYQANTLTEAEAQAAQKRIGQMQQSLQAREASLTEQLLKEQDEFNKDLKNRLDAFLKDYNKEKNYDYILSYSKTSSMSILFANENLNVTKDVIDGMNKLYGAVDTTKKKK